MSLLLGKGLTGKASATIHCWRERSFNTDDIGQGVIEGNKNPTVYQSGRAELNNVCQIWQRAAEISGTALAMQSTTFGQEIADRLVEIKQGIEKSITSGVRNDGSSSPYIRQLDGIEQWADDNNKIEAATPTQISEDDIKRLVKCFWIQGLPTGQYFALVNADLKEQIDAIYKDSYSYIHQNNVFGLLVDGVRTNYGTVYFLLSRYASPNKITAFAPDFISLDYLRQPTFETLAKTGDAISGEVVAEATLRVGSKKAVAQLTV
ncbi:hypothetical protein PACILC2_57200 [Paenibacillus cisolokensis]|uniref:Phage major capsid protein n=1 Tax=Paenibacillus cisolokensis TaxID=1658519 RepID=A0ABQ4NFW5_9BACL|nr:DUF5309 family protein [Paenibacillus cisolokensis]GIQ67152.1 hypothetical protein PACILC2_57200 [Paenibacillus cisolokensis]